MKTVLICYPKAFNCAEKFERKLTRILKNIDSYSVMYAADENHLIQDFLSKQTPTIKMIDNKNCFEQIEQITHAIIFDDGEEFPQQTRKLQAANIPTRLINIAITRVVNIKREEKYKASKSTPDYEYIGRGSYWGNPHSLFESGETRDEVIRKYQYDFDYEKFPNKEKSEVYKLVGKRLGCFCHPAPCHGDVLADYLNRWDDGK
jgi:hypothetical protein